MTRHVSVNSAMRFAAILSFAASLSAAPYPAAAQDKEPIKIGILGPYTGVFAVYGLKTIEQPVRLYLQEHGNKIAGRPVEVVVADDQGKPNVEIEKARDLVENQKVNVIIGVVNSAAALAVRDYLDKQKILTLVTVAGARDITQSRKSDAIFRFSFANGQTEPAGAVLAKLVGIKSMAAIGADYVAPHELLEALIDNFRKVGGTVPMTLWSPLGTADFSSYLAQLKQVTGEVDAVSPMLFGADPVRFFNQYREFGMDKALYVFGDVTEQTAFLDQVGETASGSKTYWYYSPYLENAENTAFRTAFLKTYNRLPGAFSFELVGGHAILRRRCDQAQRQRERLRRNEKCLRDDQNQFTGWPDSLQRSPDRSQRLFERDQKRTRWHCGANAAGTGYY